MKILQVMTELGFGGAERVVLDLCRSLISEGHTINLAVMKSLPAQNMRDEFVKLGIYPDIIGIDSLKDFRKIKKLKKLIREYKPEVIHSHLMHPNLICRAANFRSGIPLVNTVHISERRKGQQLYFFLDSLTHGLCDCYTAVSDASARFHEKAIHLEQGSIRTIRNGVDPVEHLPQDVLQEAKNRWQVSMCSKILGAVGRLDPQKGFDRLIRLLPALGKLVPDGETWGIVILGEGKSREELESQLELSPYHRLVVRLPGFEKNAASLADAFDAFVMPSRYEGYGLVFAESLSLGLPCVYQPVDSLPELAAGISNVFPARFDKPEEDSATAEKIAAALRMPRSEPEILFTVREMAVQYTELYRELLDKKGRKHV